MGGKNFVHSPPHPIKFKSKSNVSVRKSPRACLIPEPTRLTNKDTYSKLV